MRTYQIATSEGVPIPGSPFDGDRLLKMWDAGELDESTQYWSNSSETWLPIANLLGASRVPQADEPSVEPASGFVVRKAALEPYKTPVLAIVFYSIAWINLVVSAVAAGFVFTAIARSATGTGWVGVAIPFALSLFGSLILFGFGQVIDLIGRIAHDAKRAADSLLEQERRR